MQLSRGKAEAQLLFEIALVMQDVGRLAADLILFYSQEFAFVSLADEFTTGSSIMPQKRNPDVFELVRGRTAIAHACLSEALGITSKLTSGYHRDLQLSEGAAVSRHRFLCAETLAILPPRARRRTLQQGAHPARSARFTPRPKRIRWSPRKASRFATPIGASPRSTRSSLMAIWFRPFTIADIARLRKGTMVEHIGIEITEIGDDFLRGTMPVDARTRQAMGLLHGGASVALAESLGSIAGAMVIDLGRQSVVGLEINASHVRAVRSGFVTGTARPVNIGRRVQVWQVDIANAAGKPVCITRLTLFVLDRPPPPITEPAVALTAYTAVSSVRLVCASLQYSY